MLPEVFAEVKNVMVMVVFVLLRLINEQPVGYPTLAPGTDYSTDL
jgi:hypothetical protein